MKLGRLATSDFHPAPEAAHPPHAGDAVRRVEAAVAIDGDRERSLGEELASIEARALGEFEGGEKIRAEARDLAARVADLGSHADDLLKPQLRMGTAYPIDDSA